MATEIEAYGYVVAKKIFDNHEEIVFEGRNQLTTHYLDRLVQLLLQRIADQPPDENQLHSIWWEASAVDIPAPTVDDDGPDPLSTVVAQKILADVDKIDTSDGSTTRAAEVRARLEKVDAIGQTIVAIDLFNKGSIPGVPNPATWSSGDDGIYCVARQKLGSIPKTGDFAIEITWSLVLQIVSS